MGNIFTTKTVMEGRKENVFFNDGHNTFYLRLYGIGHMVKDHSDSKRGNHIGYSFQSQRQDSTNHNLCYTSCGALAGTRNSSMGPP